MIYTALWTKYMRVYVYVCNFGLHGLLLQEDNFYLFVDKPD